MMMYVLRLKDKINKVLDKVLNSGMIIWYKKRVDKVCLPDLVKTKEVYWLFLAAA